MRYLPQPPQFSFRTKAEELFHGERWQEVLAADVRYPQGRFDGRGIVFCAGGERLFVNLWVNLCLLRRVLKCDMPVEVWHFGSEELSPSMAALLRPFNIQVMDGEKYAKDLPSAGEWRGFALKTTAIIQSRFREVLFLDTDSHAVRDPSFLFEEPGYRWTGSCFWPDEMFTDPASRMWSILDIPFVSEAEWESGQLVIDKSRSWRALSLVDHLSHHFPFHYRHMYGDKMAFYAAWKKLDQPYAMTRHAAKLAAAPDSRMLLNQFDFHGGLLFQHRASADWNLSPNGENPWPEFVHHEVCREFLKELHAGWPESERTCRANRDGRVERLSLRQCLRQLRKGRSRPAHSAAEPPLPAVTGGFKWDLAARQAILTPGTVSPRLMATGIDALANSSDQEARAIFRFFAVLIFVDPRLAAMLPEDLEIKDSVLEPEWNALLEFRQELSKLPANSGLLTVRGNLFLAETPPALKADERSAVGLLTEILANSESDILEKLRTFFRKVGDESQPRPRPATPPDRSPIARPWKMKSRKGKVLVLTPLKDCADVAEGYCSRLENLTYPKELLSLGMLESDSRDGTFDAFNQALTPLKMRWRRTNLWKRDFHYILPNGTPRWDTEVQLQRRSILAQSRNELLSQALRDEDWVLWLDADVIEYPRDIIEQLLSYGKDILHPHCVLDYGGPTFDWNGWRDRGRTKMEDLRGRELLAPLDAVGGTMLFIRADLHRAGLIFPAAPYGDGNPRIRRVEDGCFDPGNPGELETEGLGIMASDMNVQCWGLPELEILHRKK